MPSSKLRLPCICGSAIAIKTAEDAERLKEVLEGWKVKDLLLQDRRNWCRHCSPFRRFLCRMKTGAWHRILIVCTTNYEHARAIIYPPWVVNIELDARTGYVGFLVGGIEKFNSELKVTVLPELHSIIIEPKEG